MDAADGVDGPAVPIMFTGDFAFPDPFDDNDTVDGEDGTTRRPVGDDADVADDPPAAEAEAKAEGELDGVICRMAFPSAGEASAVIDADLEDEAPVVAIGDKDAVLRSAGATSIGSDEEVATVAVLVFVEVSAVAADTIGAGNGAALFRTRRIDVGDDDTDDITSMHTMQWLAPDHQTVVMEVTE